MNKENKQADPHASFTHSQSTKHDPPPWGLRLKDVTDDGAWKAYQKWRNLHKK